MSAICWWVSTGVMRSTSHPVSSLASRWSSPWVRCFTRWNETEAELEGMRAIAGRFGCPHSISADVTPRDNGDRTPLEISASPQARRKLLGMGSDGDIKVERDAEIPSPDEQKHCGAGSSGIAVDPFGNVFPCVQWRRSLGNLHEQSLPEIWSSSPALGEVRRLNHEAGAMLDQLGEGARKIGFCLGLAEETTGDPLALYPQVDRKRELYLEEKRRPRLPIFGQDIA